MTEQLTLTCASKADLLSDLDDHFDSLGLTLPTFTFSLPDHPSGIAEAVMDDGTRVLVSVQEQLSPQPLAANFVFDGDSAWIWAERFNVALTSTDTTVIPTTRGDIEVPATARVTGTVRPHTPSHVISGIQPLPPIEGEDYKEADDWEQLTPGVPTEYPFSPNGYPLGWIVLYNEVRYIQDGTLEQLPTGNFFTPGTLNSLWRAVSSGSGLDPWDSGAIYQVNAEVTHSNEDWINRRANNIFEPGTVQAGWLQTSNRPYPWYHIGNEGYPMQLNSEPMRVTHNGRLWRNPTAGNTWEPGIAIWIDEGPAP